MSLLESLQGLVRAPRSAPAGGVVLGIALMTNKIHAKALPKVIRDSNRGNSSPEVEIGAVVEVAILVFPGLAVTAFK